MSSQTNLIKSLITLVLETPSGEQIARQALEEIQLKRISKLPLVASSCSSGLTSVETIRNHLNNDFVSLFEHFGYRSFYISELRKWYAANYQLSTADNVLRPNSTEPWWWKTVSKAALTCSVLVKQQGPRGYYKIVISKTPFD